MICYKFSRELNTIHPSSASPISIIAISGLFLSTLFVRGATNYFLDEIQSYYFLILLSATLPVLLLGSVVIQKKEYRINLADFFISLLVLIQIASNLFIVNNTNYSEQYIILLAIYSIYLLVRISVHGRNAIPLFIISLSLAFLFESIDILRKISELLADSNDDEFIPITGTFNNAGLLGGFMISLCPLVTYSIGRIKNVYLRPTLWSLLYFCSIIILIATQSRAALLVLVFQISAYLPWHKIKTFLIRFTSVKFIKSIAVLIGVSVGALLFFYKPASALGRIYIWKITLTHYIERPFFGWGFGSFPIEYPKWQEQYFNENESSGGFAQLADLSYVSFNEYLQILAETGIVGFFTFIAVVYSVYSSNSHQRKSDQVIVLKTTIFSILIFALFSYPFHSAPILALFFVCIALLANSDQRTIVMNARYTPVLKLITIIPITLCCYSCVYFVQQMTFVQLWIDNRQKVFEGDRNSITVLNELYGHLGKSGPFLSDYGQVLYSFGELKKAVNVMEQSKKIYTNEQTYYVLGQAYQKLHLYSDAESNFTFVNNLLPSKFRPRLLLINLYLEMGDTVTALGVANHALTIPVKVPSREVTQIINEIKFFVDEENSR